MSSVISSNIHNLGNLSLKSVVGMSNFGQIRSSSQTSILQEPSLPPLHHRSLGCRNDVVLCHGLFGFDKRGPESIPWLVSKYWHAVESTLHDLGVNVHVCAVPSTGSVRERALVLQNFMQNLKCRQVNLIAHSMGGLDCRYLITHLGTACKIASLTTIATPHHGSHFMDYLRDALGVGLKAEEFRGVMDEGDQRDALDWVQRAMQVTQGPSFSLSTADSGISVMSVSSSQSSSSSASSKKSPREIKHTDAIPEQISRFRTIFAPLDRPAYHNLTTDFCTRVFNPLTPNSPHVAYFSYGAWLPVWNIGNPLKWSAQIIQERDGDNDGLVSLNSARWGEWKGQVECDHWDLCGRWKLKVSTSTGFDVKDFWRNVSGNLREDGF